jgi:hypothetical protein
MASVTTRIDPMTLDELYRHMLSHEQRLEHLHTSVDQLGPSANMATYQPSFRGRGNRNGYSGSNNRGPMNFGGRGRGGRGALGAGPSSGGSRLISANFARNQATRCSNATVALMLPLKDPLHLLHKLIHLLHSLSQIPLGIRIPVPTLISHLTLEI